MGERTPQHDFFNRLRILRAIDRHEMAAVGIDMEGDAWPTFRDDPFRWAIAADDDEQAALWSIIERRSA